MTHIDDIEARANAATEGPWVTAIQVGSEPSEDGRWVEGEAGDQVAHFPLAGNQAHSDMDFIAHARTDVPDLVAFVRDVEALHIPREDREDPNGNTRSYCQECDRYWPCATRQALDRLNGGV